MDQPSHIQPSQLLRRSRRYGSAGTDEHEVEAVDRNRPGGSGQPPLPASRRGLALRKGGCTLGKQRDSENIRAFTLVELLIAAAITVVIVVMLGLMLGSLMTSASHASQRVDAFRDARAALQVMERDLSNLVPTQWDIRTSPIPTPTPIPITRAAAHFALDNVWQDPNDLYSANNGSLNRQIFALIARKDAGSSTSGDLCAVGYYCRWDTNHYVLCRYFRDSATTIPAIQSFPGTYVPVTTLYTPSSTDEVLAAYVWNFNVTLYDATGTVINGYDATTGTVIGASPYPYICDPSGTYNPSPATPPTPNLLPAAIEISFNAMSPQAARTVMSVSSAPADWMDATTQNYQRLVKPHAYEFHTRINFQ
jgi:type II secretory pathway pseudopilin PulG